MDSEIKIVVATHKQYQMPRDEMYFPLYVGAAGKLTEDGLPLDLGFARDDSGDNISYRNSNFGTQTGLYWAWKNLDADYIGLTLIGDCSKWMGGLLHTNRLNHILGKIKFFGEVIFQMP